MPLGVVDLGRVVHQNSFAVAEVEPELQEAVPHPEHQVVAWGGRKASSGPKQEAVGGGDLDPEIQRVRVADDAEIEHAINSRLGDWIAQGCFNDWFNP